ncbi:MAG: autotransporter-associated beta strand repeat-containing protein [Verrucomicrobia bacterium]|nr:autotransporter-associated beta strand repeat-containing protein [Verrucomicrobiota bacterium]
MANPTLPRLRFLVAAAFALSATVMPTTAKAATFYLNPSAPATLQDWSLAASWSDSLGVASTTVPGLGDDLVIGGLANVNATATSNVGFDTPVYNTLTLSNTDGLLSHTVKLFGYKLNVNSITSTATSAVPPTVTLLDGEVIFGAASSTMTAALDHTITIGGQISGPATDLTINGAGNVTILGAVDLGAANLIKDGSGTLALSNSADISWAGSTTVKAGQLLFGYNDVLSSGALNIQNGSTLDMAGFSQTSTAPAGVVTLTDGTIKSSSGTSTLTSSAAFELQKGTVSVNLAGTTGLNKTTSSTVTLSGNNSGLSGTVNIAAGTLEIKSNNALGTGKVTLTGGSLTINSDSALSLGNNVEVTVGGGVTIEAVTSALTTSVTQTLGTLKMGATSLVINRGGNFDSSATPTLVVGAVSLDSAGGTSTFGVGSVQFTTGKVTSVLNESLRIICSGSSTIAGLTLGSGNLYMLLGSGTLTLTAAASGWTGATTIADGKLVFGANDVLSSGALNIGGAQSSLDMAGFNQTSTQPAGVVTLTDGEIKSSSGTSTLTSSAAFELQKGTVSVNLAGTNGLNKTSGGDIVTLSGNNSGLSGTVNIAAGTLEIKSNNALGTGKVTMTGGSLDINSDSALTLGNNVEVSTGSAITIGAVTPYTVSRPSVTQTLGTLKIADGNLSVNKGGNFDSTETVTLAFGTVSLARAAFGVDRIIVASGVELTTGAVTSVANQSLDVRGSGNTTISGGLNLGSGYLFKNGTGRLTLSGSSALSTNATILGDGALRLNDVNALTLGLLQIQGGLVELAAADFARNLGSGVGEVEFTGTSAGFIAIGADRKVTLGAAGSTVDWATRLPTSTLILANSDSTHTLTLDNAIILDSGHRTIEVGNGSAATDAVITGAISGSAGAFGLGMGSLEKTGSGTLNLSSANTFDGIIEVSEGRLNTVAGGLASVWNISVQNGASLHGVNFNTASHLLIDQGGEATFTGVAKDMTGTIWNNGSLTLTPALGGNSTLTLDQLFGSGVTTLTRGNLVIYNNAFGVSPLSGVIGGLDAATFDPTLPADFTWGYGAGGGGHNSLTLNGTLTSDISGGTVTTKNLNSNYITNRDRFGDLLSGANYLPGPSTGGVVYLEVNVSGTATIGSIDANGGTINIGGVADIGTLSAGTVNLTGSIGSFTTVSGGSINSSTADVVIKDLSGGTHTFNGQSTTIKNFIGGTAALTGVTSVITNFGDTLGGNPTATVSYNVSVGTMKSGTLTLQGSGPTSVITTLNGGSLVIDGVDVLVTINSGNAALITGADVSGSGSLTKVTAGLLNLDKVYLTGTTRLQQGTITVNSSTGNSMGTVINDGTLSFTGGSTNDAITSLQNNSTGTVNFTALNTSVTNLSGSGILSINDSTKNLTIESGSYSGTINGVGNLVKNTVGTLVLSGLGVDNYTGTTTVNGGTLEFTSAVTLAGQVNNTNGFLNFTDTLGTTTLSTGLVANGATTTFSGKANLTQLDIVTNSTTTFRGTTNITTANINSGNTYFYGTGNITTLSGLGRTVFFSGGTTNTRSGDGTIEIYANYNINSLNGGGSILIQGIDLTVEDGSSSATISGSGSLKKESSNTLTLSGANVDNYTGTTSVNNGTLVFDHTAVNLSGAVTVASGAVLNFTALTGTTTLVSSLTNRGTTNIANNASITTTTNISGTTTIDGSYVGTDIYTDGGTTHVIGNVTASYLRNQATTNFDANAAITEIENDLSGNITIGGNVTGTRVWNRSGTTTIGGTYAGTNINTDGGTTHVIGNVLVNTLRNYATTNLDANVRTANLENTGVVTIGGTTDVTGTLSGNGTTNLTGAAAIQYRTGNGTANFSANSSIFDVSGAGTLTIASGKSLSLSNNTFSGTISGAGSIIKTGGTYLTLSGLGVDDYTGTTTVNAGTLNFSSAVTLVAQVTNDATLNFTDTAGTTTLSTGLNGSGTTSFSGSANVNVRAGTGTQNFFQDSSVTTLNGSGTVSIDTAKSLTISDGTYTGIISGANVIKTSAGTLTLSGLGVDNYTGTTTANAGTLVYDSAVTLAGQVTVNNGTLNFTAAVGTTTLSTGLAANYGATTTFSGDANVTGLANDNSSSTTFNGFTTIDVAAISTGNVNFKKNSNIRSLSSSGLVDIASGASLTISEGTSDGTIQGAGSIIKGGVNALTLSGLNVDNYTGTTTVNAGTLNFSSAVTLAAQVTNDATLNFTAAAGTTTLSMGLNGSGTTTFSGNSIIASRTGTGTVNYLGNTTVNTVSGNGSFVIAASKNLTIEAGTFTGAITGSGALVKTTAGTLTLSTGTSSYGNTVVQAGLLTVNSTITSANVTVASGATLGGSGTIYGNITVNGDLAPGNSPGILNAVGAQVLANNSNYVAEIGGLTAGNGSSNHDQFNVTGTVTIGTGVTLDAQTFGAFTATSLARANALTLIKASGGITGAIADYDGSDFTSWVLFDNNSDTTHTFGNLYGTGLSAAQTFGAWGTNTSRTAVANALWTASVTEAAASVTHAGAERAGFINTNTNAGKAALALINAGANTNAVLDSYSPEVFLGLGDYAQTTARTITDGVLGQTSPLFVQGKWNIGAGYSNASSNYTGGSSAAFDRHLSSTTNYANISYSYDPQWKAGLFYGHNSGHTNALSSTNSVSGDVLGLSLEGSIAYRYPISVKAAISTSNLHFDSSRTMALANSGDDAITSTTGTSSSTNNKLSGTSAQIGASMEVYKKDHLSVSPTLGLVYGSSKSDAFTETGSGANLAVGAMNSSATRGVVGLTIGYEATSNLGLSLSLGLEKQLGSNATSVTANFAGAPSSSFSVAGNDSKSVVTNLGLGATLHLNNGFTANLSAEFRSGNDYNQDKRVNVSLNRKF